MRRRRSSRTNIACPRPSIEGENRTANLNVRCTAQQYFRWQEAADRAGLSLSAWVARWLDEIAGVPGRVLALVEKLAPLYGGRVPLQTLEFDLRQRWGWDKAAVRQAIRHLAEMGLVLLLAGNPGSVIERFDAPDGLRSLEGVLVTHVAL